MVQHNAALYAQRGQILARAYAELPNQPKRGTSKAPLTARTITRPDGQQIEIQAGTLTAVEPFAGAGLLGLALHLEGVVTVDACEIDKWAVSTQNLNAHRWFGLGWLAKPTDARRWTPMRVKGGVDLLIGGPPCKAFSGAARMGRSQTELGPSAKDNFFPDALDWIADLQPRLVVFENAAELALNKDNRAWLDEIWAPQLLHLGYRMDVFVLYAPDFGTPQNRRRTWVVCTPIGSTWVADRDVFAKGPPPTHAAPGSEAVRARRLLPWVPMHDRLVGGCCGGYGLVDCVHLGNDQIRCRTCVSGSNFDPAPNSMGQTYGRKKLEGVTVKSRRRGRMITVGQYMMEAVSDLRPDQLRYTKFNPADFAGAFPQGRG
jgi:hypothetical protein